MKNVILEWTTFLGKLKNECIIYIFKRWQCVDGIGWKFKKYN